MTGLDPNQVIADALVMVIVAVAGGVGAFLRRWLDIRARLKKDRAAAEVKIQKIYEHLGIECPELSCMDSLFNAIRAVNQRLGIKEETNGHRVAEGGTAGVGEAPDRPEAQGTSDPRATGSS